VPRAPFQVLVLPYRHEASSLEVAVFHRADANVWQFISGGGDMGETIEEAARREANEEGGIPPTANYQRLDTTTTIPACCFAAWPTWDPDLLVVPEHAFGVEVESIALSSEHRAHEWLGYDDAMRRLLFDSNKTALWELHERLSPGSRVARAPYPLRPE